jgi:hypothetical protein
MSRARLDTLEASTILSDTAILEHVFSFVPGNWLYLGGVCRAWMRSYERIGVCEICSIGRHGPCVDSTFDWRTTLMGAVFQSPARLTWAADCGVQLTGDDQDHIQRIAGLHADV